MVIWGQASAWKITHQKNHIKPSSDVSKEIKNLSRRDARIMISLATGHNGLQKHQNRAGNTDFE